LRVRERDLVALDAGDDGVQLLGAARVALLDHRDVEGVQADEVLVLADLPGAVDHVPRDGRLLRVPVFPLVAVLADPEFDPHATAYTVLSY
jgi:hypothetical protein